MKFTISIPRESCTNAKAKYSSNVVPPDPSVHFYHWVTCTRIGEARTCGSIYVLAERQIYTQVYALITILQFPAGSGVICTTQRDR